MFGTLRPGPNAPDNAKFASEFSCPVPKYAKLFPRTSGIRINIIEIPPITYSTHVGTSVTTGKTITWMHKLERRWKERVRRMRGKKCWPSDSYGTSAIFTWGKVCDEGGWIEKPQITRLSRSRRYARLSCGAFFRLRVIQCIVGLRARLMANRFFLRDVFGGCWV